MWKNWKPKPTGPKGRPRDESKFTRFVVHKRADIKPENELKYADDTIRRAKNIYTSYGRPHPNPLNIEDKDLSKEARACWKYIFSTREYTSDDAYKNQKEAEREKAFYSADEVVFALECYTSWIRDKDFVRAFERPDESMGIMPIIPNQSNLARWLGVPSKCITNAMHNDAEAQERYKRVLADCLSEGAMAGAYQTASTIFTLKNMCDWADKYEDRSANKADDLGVAEAEEMMKQLGYSREKAKLIPPKPILEGDIDG